MVKINRRQQLKEKEDMKKDIDDVWENTMGFTKQQIVDDEKKVSNRPSYYSILPSDVRYDNNLRHIDKLLYSEITCLSNKLGYCYATNKWFADLYNTTERTISTSINNLVKYEFVTTLIEGRIYRKIYLNIDRKKTSIEEKDSKVGKFLLPKDRRKLLHNNTSSNTTSNNTSTSDIKSKQEETVKDNISLPLSLGKNYISRLVEIYHLAWKHKTGLTCYEQAKGRTAKILKELHEEYSEYEIACLIFLHFEWKGLNNDNEFINKRLSDNSYPLSWLVNSVNTYKVFIYEKLGIKDGAKLKEYVDKAINVCRGAI